MPLYEYQCTKCKHKFEKIRKFSDPPVKKCPQCGAKVEQLLSAPAIQFKGAGWYVNDYAKKSSGKSSEGSEGSESKSESKPESKTESKTEAKTEKKAPAAEKK